MAAGAQMMRIDAFFAKRAGDMGIDVHREGQLMQRIIQNPACGWECFVNPQPTLIDFERSMLSARERNVKIVHLTGHSRRECGFVWNADDAATASAETSIDSIACMIGGAAGEEGSLEFGNLSACSTFKMAQMLREAGVPDVLCWKTRVHDAIARELCEHFYRSLMRLSKDGIVRRNYRIAFDAATDAMRPHAYTGGAAHPPCGSGMAYVGDVKEGRKREENVEADY